MTTPLRFIFGVHLHQPVGNFDAVFDQHLAEVYRPFLERVDERDFLPIVLHLSGPLLEWLEAHDQGRRYLDLLGNLVTRGKVELLLAGMYEPVLAALPRRDRVEQIGWMREALRRRFGVEATGLWLTERVWEPELAADLADAGVRYALVDDRHFLVTGLERDRLHVPYTTESDGRRVTLFSIDERLRYLVPFRPPAETAAYLRELAARRLPVAVLADDGEKFGGWPGTREWVYERGWLDQFFTTIGALVDGGELVLTTPSECLAAVSSGGLVYLPTASYREMEGWALPPAQARRLAALERELGEERLAGPDGALVRGSHWRNFLVKYTEANRMQKKMCALSARCRAAGDPPEARRAIGRAQCNDAYWHGVFGGLYLPHLRDAIWAELARAEGILRAGEAAAWEELDLDADGHPELWIHDASFSALVSPARGAVIEELTVFAHGVNYANVLTRRREGYHLLAAETGGAPGGPEGHGTPSIHDLEHALQLDELPPLDPEERCLLVERVLDASVDERMYARGDYDPDWSIRETAPETEVAAGPEGITIRCRVRELGLTVLEKSYHFQPGGVLTARYRWNPAAFPAGAVFAPEISCAAPVEITCTPAAQVWTYDIATVAKSERGLERTVQGRATTARWPVALGEAVIELVPRGPAPPDPLE
jgi:alpha-amylase